MLKLKKVALTGGIASGKSFAANEFAKLGAYVVSADKIVHDLLQPKTPLGEKIIELLGADVVVDGAFDRSRIANKVFLHPKLLKSLEDILHPIVYETIENEYNTAKSATDLPPLFLAEIPLLFETKKGGQFFDATIAIIADQEICWERYRMQTGSEREQYDQRMARQFHPAKKAELSDYVIKNNGTKTDFKKEIERIFQLLKE